MSKLADEGIALSVITCGEIYEGMLSSSLPEVRRAQFEQFTRTIDLLSPDIEVARLYANTRAHLRGKGRLIPDNDLWIAATALAHDLTVVSRDEHFSRIPNLKR